MALIITVNCRRTGFMNELDGHGPINFEASRGDRGDYWSIATMITSTGVSWNFSTNPKTLNLILLMKDFGAIDLSVTFVKFCIYLVSIQTTKSHRGSYTLSYTMHAPTNLYCIPGIWLWYSALLDNIIAHNDLCVAYTHSANQSSPASSYITDYYTTEAEWIRKH